MNWCKFGFHDYEVFNERDKLISKLVKYLESRGWIQVKNEYGLKWFNPIDPDIMILNWGMFRDRTLESCIPITVNSYVCIKCGKVKLSYDVAKCLVNLDCLMDRKCNENIRIKTAKRLREKFND
jgi:hypothetical protein